MKAGFFLIAGACVAMVAFAHWAGADDREDQELREMKRATLNAQLTAQSAQKRLDALQEQVDTLFNIVGNSQPYTSGINPETKHQ